MSFGKLFLSSTVKSGNRNLLNRVKDELFYNKPVSGDTMSERDMLSFIRRHILQYRVLPTPGVLQAAGVPYVDTDQPPEYYIEEIKKRAVYNAFKDFSKNITPVITQDFDLDSAYDLITNFSSAVSSINASDRYKSVAELGRELEAQIEHRKNGGREIFIPFGWPTLDSITGGASGGDLIYFVGRPGQGKTNVIIHNSVKGAWENGFSPMVVSMEMTDLQISRRVYGTAGQFDPNSIRRGIPDSEVERRLAESITAFENGPAFHIVSGQTKQTVDSIAALVDELNPDVLYIDAAYLVKMAGPSKQMWERIAAIGEQLKQLAISRDIPIIQTVQFNREAAKGKKFELETIAGSDAIGQLGSIICAINAPDDQYKDSQRIITTIKNRDGALSDFRIYNRFDPPDFNELSPVAGSNVEADVEVVI